MHPRPAARPHGHAAHALHATADTGAGLTAHDLTGNQVDRYQARCTESVDLGTWNGLVIVRIQHADAGNVSPLLTHGLHAPQDHIIEQGCVELIACPKCGKDGLHQLNGWHGTQRAAPPALSPRGSDGIIDVGLIHRLPHGMTRWSLRSGGRSSRPAPSVREEGREARVSSPVRETARRARGAASMSPSMAP